MNSWSSNRRWKRVIRQLEQGGRLLGLFTAEYIGELLMIRTARAQFPAVPPPQPHEARRAFTAGR